MKLTHYADYKVDFASPWTEASAALVGVFLFLRALYYFGCQDVTKCGTGELWIELILPGILAIGYIVLLRGVKLQFPVVYAGIGAAMCLMVIIWGFRSGGGTWAVLGLIWYLLAAAVLAGTVLGYLPTRLILLGAFFLPALVRILTRDLKTYILPMEIKSFLPELSILCILFGLGCLALALQPKTE